MSKELQSTSLQGDSLAKTLASQDAARDLKENVAASGSSSQGSSKKSSRSTRSSKTSQPFGLEDWIKFSGRSLRSGTMRSGIVYPQKPLVRLTRGTVSGLSRTRKGENWTTPSASDATRSGTITKNMTGISLAQQVNTPHLWPTPAAHEGRLGYQRRDTGKKGTQKSLTTLVIDSLGGREATSGQLNPTWVEWLMGFPIGHTDLKD